MTDALPPLRGRYELRERIGQGGAAEVFRAYDPQLRRDVAVKMLRELSPQARARFDREATTVATLAHPGIIAVYDFGEDQGRAFLVLELLAGGTLGDFLLRRPPLRRVVELIERIARAVHHAHERGLVHRDLKPQNILLAADGSPKVADFGLAHLMDARERITRTGTAVGTPVYMAPEQVEGSRRIDARTDVYALGAILYEALAGRPPHLGATAAELFHRILQDEPVPPRSMRPETPADLETIALQALRKRPVDRYASAAEFADDLRRHLAGEPVAAHAPSTLQRMTSWVHRRRLPLVASVAALALLAAAAALVRWRQAAGRLEETALFLPLEHRLDSLRMAFYRRDFRMRDADFDAFAALVRDIEEQMRRTGESAQGRYLIGRCLEAAGDPAGAERSYAAAPGHGPCLLARGRLAIETALAARGIADDAGRAARSVEDSRQALDLVKRGAALAREPSMLGDLAAAYVRLIETWDRREPIAAAPMLERWRGRPLVEEFELVEALSRPADALARLRDITDRVPGWSRAWFWRGAHQSDNQARLADFDLALAINPRDAAATDHRGAARRALGDVAGAIADHTRALELDPRSAYAHNNRGVALMHRGDLAAAVADFTRAVELDPRHATALSNRSEAHRRRKDYEAAIADATRALQLDPRHAKALCNRGAARADAGDIDGAIRDCDAAMAIDRSHVEALANRGEARRRGGDVRGAIADLERATALSPPYAFAWRCLGMARRDARDLAGAVRDGVRSVELDPADPYAWANLAHSRSEAGDDPGAIRDYDRAIELAPTVVGLIANRARARLRTRDFDGAIADCTRAIELQADAVPAWTTRAAARYQKDDLRGCIVDSDRAIEIDPRSAPAHYNRGVARVAAGELDTGLADLTRAIELDPNDSVALLARGWARGRKGDVDGAIEDTTEALRLNPRFLEALTTRAVARRRKGNPAGARQDLEKALEIAPRDWPGRAKTEADLRDLRP